MYRHKSESFGPTWTQEALTRGEKELRGVHQARQQERAKLGVELDTLRQEQDRLRGLASLHQGEAAKLRQELEAAQKLGARAEQEQRAAVQGRAQAQQSLQQLTQQLQEAGKPDGASLRISSVGHGHGASQSLLSHEYVHAEPQLQQALSFQSHALAYVEQALPLSNSLTIPFHIFAVGQGHSSITAVINA